jgi:hypothetical protein
VSIIVTLLVVDVVLVMGMLVPVPFARVQRCGVLDQTRIARLGDPYVTTTGNCFGQAFLACQPASITFVSEETQFRILTVEKHFIGCNILDTVQQVRGMMRYTTTYMCTGMHFSRWGLIINGCGDDRDVWLLVRTRLR